MVRYYSVDYFRVGWKIPTSTGSQRFSIGPRFRSKGKFVHCGLGNDSCCFGVFGKETDTPVWYFYLTVLSQNLSSSSC